MNPVRNVLYFNGRRVLTINTDGGARGNPGQAGIGVVIKDESGKVVEKFGRYLGDNSTNNQAEYEAVVAALQAAKKLGGTVLEFHMDSELAVRQLNHIYKVKNAELQALLLKAKNLQAGFSKVTFTHVPRVENREADTLVNEAIDNNLKQ